MALLGIKTTLKIGADTIGEITALAIGGQTRDAVDTTTMDSTNQFREKIPGLKDAGEITVTVEYDAAAAAVSSILQTKLESSPETVMVEFADKTTTTNSSFSCSGFVSNLSIAIPMEDKITQDVTITLTGEPTFTTHD